VLQGSWRVSVAMGHGLSRNTCQCSRSGCVPGGRRTRDGRLPPPATEANVATAWLSTERGGRALVARAAASSEGSARRSSMAHRSGAAGSVTSRGLLQRIWLRKEQQGGGGCEGCVWEVEVGCVKPFPLVEGGGGGLFSCVGKAGSRE
jgi:hypothetical protein